MDDTILSPRWISAEDAAVPAPPYVPLPVHALPGIVGRYVSEASAAIGCDASYVALPLLACLGRAIGLRRTIRLKRTWTEPAVIWGAIVGRSGTHKSPALALALDALLSRQKAAMDAHAAAMIRYHDDLARYERDRASWSRSKSADGDPPAPPREPVCQRYITTDATIEALAALLADQPDGLLVERDELAGWLGGIAEYKGGRGSDLGHWLAMWSARPLTIDRKTGAARMVHVPRAAVSLVGGVQPDVLRRAIGREHMQDGLCARLLLAMPEPRPVRWTEAEVAEDTTRRLDELVGRLLSVEWDYDDDGEPHPRALPLAPPAKRAWVAYYDRHRAQAEDLDDDLAAAWSKLEAYAARLALIVQMCRWAEGAADEGSAIGESAMLAGIELSDWFGGEARRVYAVLGAGEDDGQRDSRRLVEWIARRGGAVTARDVRKGCRWLRAPLAAEAALAALATSGVGQWVHTSSGAGGRPTSVLRLSDLSAHVGVGETPGITGKPIGFADADNGDAPADAPDDDPWAALNGHPAAIAADDADGRPTSVLRLSDLSAHVGVGETPGITGKPIGFADADNGDAPADAPDDDPWAALNGHPAAIAADDADGRPTSVLRLSDLSAHVGVGETPGITGKPIGFADADNGDAPADAPDDDPWAALNGHPAAIAADDADGRPTSVLRLSDLSAHVGVGETPGITGKPIGFADADNGDAPADAPDDDPWAAPNGHPAAIAADDADGREVVSI